LIRVMVVFFICFMTKAHLEYVGVFVGQC
jgi:hypothetical protein